MDTMNAPQPTEADLSPMAVAALTAEAPAPETTPDSVQLHGHTIPIKLMPIKREREVLKLLSGVLPKLMALQGASGNQISPQDVGFMSLFAVEAADILPQAVAIIAAGVEGVDLD